MQRECLLGQPNKSQRASAQESKASRFRPWASALQRAKRGGAAPGSLGPAALLGVSGTRNPLPTGSPWRGSRIGHAMAFYAQAAAMTPEPTRAHSAEATSHRRPKTRFWQLHSAKGKFLTAAINSPHTPQVTKQRKPFLPPALHSPEGKAGLGCPWLPGPCCFAGGLRCPKPTPHGFSFVGKQDWAREGRLRPGPSHAP